MFKKITTCILVTAFLTSCVTNDRDRAKFNDINKKKEKLTFRDYEKILLPKASKLAKNAYNKKFKKNFKIPKLINSPSKNEVINSNKLVSLSVTQEVPIKDILLEISRLANVDIELDSNITGGITLQVNNKPFSEVIKRISKLANLRYSVDKGILHVERDLPYIHNYELSLLNLTRSSQSSYNISTQGLGGSTNGGVNTGRTSTIDTEYKGNNWEIIEKNIKQIIGSKSKDYFIAVNQPASLLTVKADFQTHQKIQKYLDLLNKSINSQVLIEAKVVEVKLEDNFANGIDWKMVGQTINSITGQFNGAYSNFGTSSLGDNSGSLAFSTSLFGNDLSAGVNFLQAFGTTKSLASPRILATNNQQAVMTFAENHVYFSVELDEEEEDKANSNSTEKKLRVTSTKNTLPIGLILSLQPSINLKEDSVSLSIKPTMSRISGQIKDPGVSIIAKNLNISGIDSYVPIVEIKELDTIMQVKSGEVIVIGGLMEDREVTTQQGVPLLGSLPVLGNLFKNKIKNKRVIETVILLKATIIKNKKYHTKSDSILYNTFTRDRHHLGI